MPTIRRHGATFGANLSLFHRFDGRSWADELNEAGLDVWGFDFAGYGGSDRYPAASGPPAGRIDDVIPQLDHVSQRAMLHSRVNAFLRRTMS